MFHPIEIPFGSKMLFNVVDLKDGVTIEDVELLLGEMCNIVKNNYGDDNGGFVGGQVFRNAGFISEEGSVQDDTNASKRVEQNMGYGKVCQIVNALNKHNLIIPPNILIGNFMWVDLAGDIEIF